ncbi:MAG: alkaline phosphatase family protein [Acidobacteria bacterium]|nr:alkaline phosphatase family protein [Acidobacteriota bacterium]
MLTNSVIGGTLAATYLGILVLQLNPELPASPRAVAPLFLTLAGTYGVHLAVTYYALIVVWELFGEENLSPGWLSLRLLVWLSAASSGAAATLMWLNLRGFAVTLEPAAGRRMAAGAVAVSLCALIFLVIALVHYSFGRRGSRVSATLFALTAIASVALPLAARGPARPASNPYVPAPYAASPVIDPVALEAPQAPRVLLIMLDGASLDVIAPAAAEGHLPNFGRILDSGAVMHLASLRPTQPAPIWTAVATGKWPSKNGVRSAALYRVIRDAAPLSLLPDLCFAHALVRFGFLLEEPYSSGALRATPLWNILSHFGVSVGIVGWPLTHPTPPVRGYIVSDRFSRFSEPFEGAERVGIFPAEVMPAVRTAASQPEATSAGAADAAAVEPAPLPPLLPLQGAIDAALQADLATERISTLLIEGRGVQFSAVRYQSLDAAGHYLLRYARPRAFGDVSEDERRQYGLVLERHYGHIDQIIGRTLARLTPRDLLLVVSGFGMEPLTPGKRLLERTVGNARLSGTHEAAPDGFLLAFGAGIAAGRRPRASVVDVAPSILYFLGLPVGRDMDGYARTDLFTRAFTADRPIAFIPTYDR